MTWHADVVRFLFRLRRGFVAYEKYLLLETALPSKEWVASIPVEFRLATPQDIKSLTPEEHGYGEAEKERAKRRLEEGQPVIIGAHQDKIVYINWFELRQFEFFGVKLALGSGWAFGGEALTVEAYRNKGLGRAGWYYASCLLRSQGAKRCTSWVSVQERGPVHTWLSSGSRIIGSMCSVRVLRWRRFSRVPKWLGGLPPE